MSEERKDKRKGRVKMRWAKYSAWVAGVLILLVLVIIVVGHFWLVPRTVHREVEQGLLRFWDGQVGIDGLDINYFGPIYLGEVRFTDRTGRECLCAGMVKMVFEKWPGLHPVVTEVEIGRLSWRISAPDGKLALPVIHTCRQRRDSKKKLHIRKLAINEAEIIITDAQGSKTLYDNLQLSAVKKGDFYTFLLSRSGDEPLELFLVDGKVNLETLETEFALRMKHTAQKAEAALVFAALGVPKLSAEGRLTADLTVTGRLGEPAGLEPEGVISFDGWTVVRDENIIVNNLAGEAAVKGRRIDFGHMTAGACDGSLTGSSYVEAEPNQPTEFGGQVSAQKMSFMELTSLLGGPGKEAAKGSVAFNYSFFGQAGDLQKLSGEGQVFLDDADITVIPVVPHIFRALGLVQFDPLRMSDAQCTFSMAGPVVVIKGAHIANRLAAIKAKEGGTINLQTGQIDIYVVAALLKQIDAIIEKVPVVNIFAALKDKLVRLHVRGHWSDPPGKLITKEPIKDIKEGTVGFLQDLVKSGGQITAEMRKRLGVFTKSEKETNK